MRSFSFCLLLLALVLACSMRSASAGLVSCPTGNVPVPVANVTSCSKSVTLCSPDKTLVTTLTYASDTCVHGVDVLMASSVLTSPRCTTAGVSRSCSPYVTPLYDPVVALARYGSIHDSGIVTYIKQGVCMPVNGSTTRNMLFTCTGTAVLYHVYNDIAVSTPCTGPPLFRVNGTSGIKDADGLVYLCPPVVVVPEDNSASAACLPSLLAVFNLALLWWSQQ